MKNIALIGCFALFMVSCSNGTQVEVEDVKQLEQEIHDLEDVDHELNEIKEEGDSLERLLNEIEN